MSGHRIQIQGLPLKLPDDLVKWADMGPDFVGLIERRLRVIKSCSIEASRIGEEPYANHIVGLAGENQLEGVSEEHKIVDGIGYFENLDLWALVVFSPVFIKAGDINFDPVPDLVHQIQR